jgi:hypothetical protein
VVPSLNANSVVFIGRKKIKKDINYEEHVNEHLEDYEIMIDRVDKRNAVWHVRRSIEEQEREDKVPIGLDWGVRIDDAALALVLNQLGVSDLVLLMLLFVLLNHCS